jgi:hypothetical protein
MHLRDQTFALRVFIVGFTLGDRQAWHSAGTPGARQFGGYGKWRLLLRQFKTERAASQPLLLPGRFAA